ncbi:MAG: hypothetical protein QF615_14290 [Planctomycetota bacterium]|nr:hypothetical protein [Planctomycetota bacterium]
MRIFKHRDEKLDRKVGGTVLSLSELRSLPSYDAETISSRNRERFDGAIQTYHSPNKWHGSDDPKVLADRIAGKWPEGRNNLRKLEQDLTGAATTLGVSDCRRKIAWADQGDEIDIHRVYSGDLDTAWQTTRRNGTGLAPIVSIVAGWGGHCGRSHDELFWSGAAALVSAHILEGAGYSVEILAASVTRHTFKSVGQCVVAVRLKNSDTPLELSSIAATACFAGTFRTLGLAAMCLQPTVKVTGSYGVPEEPSAMEVSKWPTEGQPILIDGSYTRETAVANVRKVLHSVETGVFTD